MATARRTAARTATAPRTATVTTRAGRTVQVPAREVAQEARNNRASAPPPGIPQAPLLNPRLQVEYLDINDIVPYEWNPRQNAEAVKSVAASMKLTGGFAMPVIVDANNVLIAGHTRTEAAKSLGIQEIPIIRLTHLSPEQVNAFRVIDNKVAEQAKWDHELLAGEIGKLADLGLDFTDYGWTQGEIDCLSEMVRDDCLETAELTEGAQTATAGNQERRAPATARVVIGEIVFFIDAGVYRRWVDGVRQLHRFDEAAITADLKDRLGIME